VFGRASSERGRHETTAHEASEPQRRRTVYAPSKDSLAHKTKRSDQSSRELVFFTDDFPERINAIINNPFCTVTNPDADPDLSCAVVTATVCVLLEEDDDEAAIRGALVNGIGNAIQSGDFEAAIPAEHKGEFSVD
jgi:hypothetical protein